MNSIPAQEVAKEVSENIRKGKRPNLGKIIRSKGYTESTSKSPQRVTDTKSYQEAISPIVDEYKKLQEKIMKELNRKGRTFTKEKLIFLSGSLKNTTHDLQLLTGGKTENNGIGELAEQLNSWINSKK